MAGNGDGWQTIPEAGRTLGKSTRTIYRWARQGRIPVRRDVSPIVVNVSNVAPTAARMAPASRQEPEGLQAEIARLRKRVQEGVQERDYLRMLAGTLAQGQQRMLEARPRRRWRWPWQRGAD